MSIEQKDQIQRVNVFDRIEEYRAFLNSLIGIVDNSTHQQHKLDGDLTTFHTGLPPKAKIINAGGRDYCHYTRNELFDVIVTQGLIISGKVPYTRVASMSRDYWMHLNGVFLTNLGIEPGKVGVPDSKIAVRVNLPTDFPLLQLEPHVFLIPNINGQPIYVPI